MGKINRIKKPFLVHPCIQDINKTCLLLWEQSMDPAEK